MKKDDPPPGTPKNPFEKTLVIEDPEKQPNAAAPQPSLAPQPPPAAPLRGTTPASGTAAVPSSAPAAHPLSGTLVMNPPEESPKPGAAASTDRHPLDSTAIIADDEVKLARARLGQVRATPLGAVRLSAPEDPPTSTRAPFTITAPKSDGERGSSPSLPPWQEKPSSVQPVLHPLSRTQEAAPMDIAFDPPKTARSPSDAVPVQPAPAVRPAAPTLPSRPDIPLPPMTGATLPSRPDIPLPPVPAAPAPRTPDPKPATPGASPYGRDLPPAEPPRAAPPPPKPEAIKLPERKEVSQGLYTKFGKRGS